MWGSVISYRGPWLHELRVKLPNDSPIIWKPLIGVISPCITGIRAHLLRVVCVVFGPLKARRDVQETAEDLSKRWRENRGIKIRIRDVWGTGMSMVVNGLYILYNIYIYIIWFYDYITCKIIKVVCLRPINRWNISSLTSDHFRSRTNRRTCPSIGDSNVGSELRASFFSVQNP